MDCLERSTILIQNAKMTRLEGVEGLNRSIKLLSKAITIMNSNGDRKVDSVLLAEAYWLHVLCSYEANPSKKLLIKDVRNGLQIWKSRESTQSTEQALPLVYHIADLLSLKGHMKLHAELYMEVISLLVEKGKSLGECLALIWQTRSLSHPVCTSPVNEYFIKALAKRYEQTISAQVWISGMGTQKSLQVGFEQSFSVVSTLSTLRSTRLYDDVTKAASDLIDSQSNNSLFFAAHLYYDLGERMLAEGLMIEACHYAKKSLSLRQEFFDKHFRYSRADDDTFFRLNAGDFVHPERAVTAWPCDNPVDLYECLITPWNVLKAFLESTLQVATMEEMVGNGSAAKKQILRGKDISSFLHLRIFEVLFSIALGKVYSGQRRLVPALLEIKSAGNIMNDESFLVKCSNCKALWLATVNQQNGDMVQTQSRPTSNPLNAIRSEFASESYEEARRFLIHTDWKKNSVCEAGEASVVKIKLCDALLSNDNSNNPSQYSGRKTIPSKVRAETGKFGGATSEVKCWHCLPSEIMNSESMISKIEMKWECARRRILLRVLIGIGNLHICCDSEKICEIHEVLLESISVLVSRNTYCSSRFSNFKAFLAKLIKEEVKANMFALEHASILYNICLFSLRSICNKGIRNDESHMLVLPIQSVVAGLKLCFILCSEVPSLSQKVSRLLAIVYILSSSDSGFPKLSSPVGLEDSHLAAFFHQTSVGTGFNHMLFSHVREQKDHTDIGSSRHSSTCLRRAPESVGNFEAFIHEFFEGLPCVATICVSSLGNDLAKLLPKQSYQWLMVSRFISKRVPLAIVLPIDEAIDGKEEDDIGEDISDLFDAKEYANQWSCPWGYSIIDDIAPLWKKTRRNHFVMRGISEIIRNYETVIGRMDRLDKSVAFLLRSIEKLWFGSWKHIFLGECQENRNLELLLEKSKKGCHIGGESQDRIHQPPDYPVDREPVILVLDSDIQMLPWESLPILIEHKQEAYRMPSIASIMYTIGRCRPQKEKEAQQNDFAAFPICDPADAFYLLNPYGDLISTEAHYKGWLENQYVDGWSGLKNLPSEEMIITALKKRDLVLFIGHGEELHLIHPQKIDRGPAAFLVACNSAQLTYKGSYNPEAVVLDFLIDGSPFVIGMLWEVTGIDVKNLVEVVLDDWITTRSSSSVGCTKCLTNGDGNSFCKHSKMVGACFGKARDSCYFTHASGSAMVCYGVPTYLYNI